MAETVTWGMRASERDLATPYLSLIDPFNLAGASLGAARELYSARGCC